MLIDSFEINNLFIPFYFEKKKCLNSLFKQGIIKNALSNDYGKRSVFFLLSWENLLKFIFFVFKNSP